MSLSENGNWKDLAKALQNDRSSRSYHCCNKKKPALFLQAETTKQQMRLITINFPKHFILNYARTRHLIIHLDFMYLTSVTNMESHNVRYVEDRGSKFLT